MRRNPRIDANQPEIASALRKAGATVSITSAVGKGFPDIVVGFRGRNYLLEIKDGSKVPSAQKLTPDEQNWHNTWRGQVLVVNSVNSALAALGLFPPEQQ